MNKKILFKILLIAVISTLLGACKSSKQLSENTSDAVETAVDETSSSTSEEQVAAESQEGDEILTIADEMPMYPGCKAFTVYRERKACAANKFYQYTLKNLVYPPLALENGVQGTVVIGFTVNKDGTRSDVRILQDIGYGCGEAALNLINSMPNWEPGIQDGETVAVRYQLPVKFRLK